MKKLISLVLALAMIMMVAAASAATIKIDRDASYAGTGARTYTAYKVFDADKAVTAGTNTTSDTETITYGDDAISYSVANNSPWLTALADDDQIWFDVKDAADGSKKIVTLKSGVTNNTATAKAIAAYFAANIPSGLTGTTITPGDGTQDATTVDDGYYIIVASDGATNLTLVTGNVVIHEKNTYITTTKTSPQTSHYIGENVPYTATVYIPEDTNSNVPVIVHDTMDSVLKFNEDVVATIDGTAYTGFTPSYATTGGWTISDGCTFEISIPVNSDTLGKTITFTYSAEVTSAAATETGLVNDIFGQHGDYRTTPVDVYDYTFGFPFEKLFVGSDNTELTAHFELRTTAADTATAIFFGTKDATSGIQKKVDTDDGTGSKDLVISNKETINLAGLEAGTYYLVETATSIGYNLLDKPVQVRIEDTTTDKKNPTRKVYYKIGDAAETEVSKVSIENNSGTVLPSTGGIGTTIFYIVGGMLLVGAAIVLVARRKASEN